MLTVQWQRSFEGLSLALESHKWIAGERLAQTSSQLNIMQACTRRPVRARLARPIGNEQRLGRIVLTPAGVTIPVETLGEESDFPVRKFEFDPDWLNHLTASSIDFDFTNAEAQPVFDNPDIAATLNRIHTEMVNPQGGSAQLLPALIRVLAIDMARLLLSRSQESSCGSRNLTVEQLARVRLAIETIDLGKLTACRVAEECGMSVARLREAFRNTTGSSLRQEIESARINFARQMLVETGQPLKVIAHALGFAHPSAFCYFFKRETGLTPTEYRRKIAAVCSGLRSNDRQS